MELDELLLTLKIRFNKHRYRHPNISFPEIELILKNNVNLLDKVMKMEVLDGEVDVVEMDEHLYFVDMYKEVPLKRASMCYDAKSRFERKEHAPISSALEEAEKMGTTLVDEKMYFYLQSLEDFDLKTSSWLLTDQDVRDRGGAIFGDKRYGRTFIYHNGASSYYASRGFRTFVKIR